MSKYIQLISDIKGYKSSEHLDLLRGIAAFLVCFGHLRNLFFVDYTQAENKNIILQIVYYFSGFGHQSVIIFFVLSGFFISGSIIKQYQEQKYSWKKYLVNRLTRLYLVLIPALSIGGLWDFAGIHLFGETNNIYGGQAFGANLINSFNAGNKLSGLILLGNIAFLQNITVPTFGSNAVVWTLNYEFWYYILFPLLFLIFMPPTSFKRRFIYTIIAIAVLRLIGWSMIMYFTIWLMGAIVSICGYWKIPQNKYNLSLYSALIFLLLMLAVVRFGFLKGEFYQDFILGIVSAILIYVLLQDKTPSNNGLYKKFSYTISSFSYTLYLVHLPVLIFCQAWLITNNRWQPNLFYLSMGVILLVIVNLYAFAMAQITEGKTDQVRKFVLEKIKAN